MALRSDTAHHPSSFPRVNSCSARNKQRPHGVEVGLWGGDENINLMQMLLLLYLPLGKANWEFVVVVSDVLVW